MSMNTGFKVREREARAVRQDGLVSVPSLAQEIAGGAAERARDEECGACATRNNRPERFDSVLIVDAERAWPRVKAAVVGEAGPLRRSTSRGVSPSRAPSLRVERMRRRRWACGSVYVVGGIVVVEVAIVKEGGGTLVKRSQGRPASGPIRKNTERLHASHALVPITCSRHLAGTFHLVLKLVVDVYSAQLQAVAAKMGDQARKSFSVASPRRGHRLDTVAWVCSPASSVHRSSTIQSARNKFNALAFTRRWLGSYGLLAPLVHSLIFPSLLNQTYFSSTFAPSIVRPRLRPPPTQYPASLCHSELPRIPHSTLRHPLSGNSQSTPISTPRNDYCPSILSTVSATPYLFQARHEWLRYTYALGYNVLARTSPFALPASRDKAPFRVASCRKPSIRWPLPLAAPTPGQQIHSTSPETPDPDTLRHGHSRGLFDRRHNMRSINDPSRGDWPWDVDPRSLPCAARDSPRNAVARYRGRTHTYHSARAGTNGKWKLRAGLPLTSTIRSRSPAQAPTFASGISSSIRHSVSYTEDVDPRQVKSRSTPLSLLHPARPFIKFVRPLRAPEFFRNSASLLLPWEPQRIPAALMLISSASTLTLMKYLMPERMSPGLARGWVPAAISFASDVSVLGRSHSNGSPRISLTPPWEAAARRVERFQMSGGQRHGSRLLTAP
ncbi:hypothetical protein B0H17DRAFT_1180692 [Mycena rosella]|uniref:Uncharacterized protein n=1 Tax=Mycena rosella TaxID=1033263 RepID=A0AAD7DC96_MYCRO|nr:hypothetical protein B0H17DRAFT_1180692 [Mycena rosella]